MRLVIQRVLQASVAVAGQRVAHIERGLLLLLGVETADTASDAEWLVRKTVALRIFADQQQHMNLSLADVQGEALVVSQFTLYAATAKGNRPSFVRAARPEVAIPLYEYFLEQLQLQLGTSVQAGIFGADMQVSLVNDGPVTIILDSRNRE